MTPIQNPMPMLNVGLQSIIILIMTAAHVSPGPSSGRDQAARIVDQPCGVRRERSQLSQERQQEVTVEPSK